MPASATDWGTGLVVKADIVLVAVVNNQRDLKINGDIPGYVGKVEHEARKLGSDPPQDDSPRE
jgi:hypothetical protein